MNLNIAFKICTFVHISQKSKVGLVKHPSNHFHEAKVKEIYCSSQKPRVGSYAETAA